MGIVVFNGISTLDYDITVEQPPNYTGAKRDYESKHIPGRNGDLILDSGSYQNVNREYNLAVGSEQKSFAQLSNILSKWVYSGTGYARLEDSYDPDVYRMAIYNNELQVTNVLNHIARATVSFNCMPQRWLKSGEITHSFFANLGGNTSVTLTNPTGQPAKPIITIHIDTNAEMIPDSEGLVYFRIIVTNQEYLSPRNYAVKGTYEYCIGIPYSEIQNGSNMIEIDCENMTTFLSKNGHNPYNLNPNCKFTNDTTFKNFIRLYDGQNEIRCSYGNEGSPYSATKYTKVEVIPRWWMI